MVGGAFLCFEGFEVAQVYLRAEDREAGVAVVKR
jgi:predicted DNA repair protein MutK